MHYAPIYKERARGGGRHFLSKRSSEVSAVGRKWSGATPHQISINALAGLDSVQAQLASPKD